MPRSVQKAPCWALQGRAAQPGEGGWGGPTVGLQACNTAHGLGARQFSAKFLVTRILLFQTLQVIQHLLSLSLDPFVSWTTKYLRFCLLNTYPNGLSSLPDSIGLLLWLPSLPCCLQPFSSLTCFTKSFTTCLSSNFPATFSTVQSALFPPAHVLALGLGCSLQTHVSPLRK